MVLQDGDICELASRRGERIGRIRLESFCISLTFHPSKTSLTLPYLALVKP